jgi:hypothetical protein
MGPHFFEDTGEGNIDRDDITQFISPLEEDDRDC